jgi:hypothetical protein
MARLVLLLLLALAGGLVVALYFDRRGRRDERIERLRWAFLHGTPLGHHSSTVSLAGVAHPAGLRFRAPSSWTIDMDQAGAPAGDPGAGRRVLVEVLHLDAPAAEGPEAVAAALKRLPAQGERSVEVLPTGNVLMKTVEALRHAKGPCASYTWHLARALPSQEVQLAVFRFRLPVETAADVIAQADLATLDREVRDATFA